MSGLHRARRLALQGLCCLDAQGEKVMDLVYLFIEDSRETPQTIAAARQMVAGAFARRDHCDEFLVRHARHWELGRLALVDRNILRLATGELLDGATPFRVVISEAIRLAKVFSTGESPRFVNGVLDAVAREIRSSGADGAAAGHGT